MYYFHKRLKELGVDDKLKELGVCDGDTVVLEGYELEWYE
jgi:Obg family GTPase CgtA-like protein